MTTILEPELEKNTMKMSERLGIYHQGNRNENVLHGRFDMLLKFNYIDPLWYISLFFLGGS